MVETACSISIDTLRATPFSHSWGSSIHAKVIAMNMYGDSEFSETGNGAIILTYPDAPTNFQENYSLRTATELAFSWNEGA